MGKILVSKRNNKKGVVWQYKFEIMSVNGKRKWESKSGFLTKKEAMLAGQMAYGNYKKTGISIVPAEMSFSDLLDLYIKNDVMMHCVDTTVKGYQKKIRLYIKPALGKYAITSISRQDIKDFLASMYNQGFSLNTISSCKGIISACFNYAIDNQFIFYSPSANIKPKLKGGRPPKTATRCSPHVYVPYDKMLQILQRFPEGSPDHMALMLGYHCGLRLGEAFGLTWDDVDFDNRILFINRQIQWQSQKTEDPDLFESESGYWYFCSPKYDSYRALYLDDEMFDLLCREKNKQERSREYYASYYTDYYTDTPLLTGGVKPQTFQVSAPVQKKGKYRIDFVNVRENGAYITPRTMQYTSSVIHHKMNYPEWDYHSLRHTHATMLSERGAHETYIQSRLGHAQSKTTHIYTNHVTGMILDSGNRVLRSLF